MQRYLDPTNDVGFKKVFSDPNRLIDFLNSILRLPEGKKIQSVEFVPTEEIPDLGQGKRSLFDLKCQEQTGTYFLIEMQSRRTPAFIKRMQYYGAHAYTAHAKRGRHHSELLPVVVIAVLKESVLPDEIEVISYHRVLEEKTGEQYLKDLSYVFVELDKFKKTEAELNSFEDEWLYFLKQADSISKPPKQLKDFLVLEAFETMEMANWSTEEYDAYIRARLLLETEELSSKEQFDSGKAVGLAEGWEAAQKEIARKMLQLGMDAKAVSEATGLSLETVNSL